MVLRVTKMRLFEAVRVAHQLGDVAD